MTTSARRAEVGRAFVVAVDGVIDVALANDLAQDMSVVRLFNSRMRVYETLPAKTKRMIARPWHLTPSSGAVFSGEGASPKTRLTAPEVPNTESRSE